MSEITLTKKDFESDQEVRWCPGCGDYAILATMQKTLPKLGISRENTVFVSGIGCASRFPYYLNTYGFHTIHGRAPTIATGLKMARPELSVWVVTGDGDGLSIGTSHLLHLMRRNVDVNVLLFNNRIYGLTKGQTSPTSQTGTYSKSTPGGSIDAPFNPVSLALSAGATFVGRAIDVDAQGLGDVLMAAAAHRGTSFVEIYQNCHVFNDGAFADFAPRALRDERTLTLPTEGPLRFGADGQKVLTQSASGAWDVQAFEEGRQDLLHFNRYGAAANAWALSQLNSPELPVVLGVFHQAERPVYEVAAAGRTRQARPDALQNILAGEQTWVKN